MKVVGIILLVATLMLASITSSADAYMYGGYNRGYRRYNNGGYGNYGRKNYGYPSYGGGYGYGR
ncbi:Hypothetical predicted protein [Mytilus galloprovincialis]|uniref:Foot protein-3 n=1 Tax=Mytilus galloprovincialis TaxID=29158 RepID=A0A8B6DI91_MYTGA|nr:Hypothetical predicted protein [Mytilus galloprovincialis]